MNYENELTPAPFPIRTHDYAVTSEGEYIGLIDVDRGEYRVRVDSSESDDPYWMDADEHLKKHLSLMLGVYGQWWKCRARLTKDVLTEVGVLRHDIGNYDVYMVRSEGHSTNTYALCWDTHSSDPAVSSPIEMEYRKFKTQGSLLDELKDIEGSESLEELDQWCEESVELLVMLLGDFPDVIGDGLETRMEERKGFYENRAEIRDVWEKKGLQDYLREEVNVPMEALFDMYCWSVMGESEREATDWEMGEY